LVWAPTRLATLQTVNSTVRAFATRCFTLSYAIGKEPSQGRCVRLPPCPHRLASRMSSRSRWVYPSEPSANPAFGPPLHLINPTRLPVLGLSLLFL